MIIVATCVRVVVSFIRHGHIKCLFIHYYIMNSLATSVSLLSSNLLYSFLTRCRDTLNFAFEYTLAFTRTKYHINEDLNHCWMRYDWFLSRALKKKKKKAGVEIWHRRIRTTGALQKLLFSMLSIHQLNYEQTLVIVFGVFSSFLYRFSTEFRFCSVEISKHSNLHLWHTIKNYHIFIHVWFRLSCICGENLIGSRDSFLQLSDRCQLLRFLHFPPSQVT